MAECIDGMDTYSSETFNGLKGALSWLHEWPCARKEGLGTKLPWDPVWVIESLSDSTIYMSYYTIAHLLQGANNLDGTKRNPIGIKAEQMTDEVWSHILLGEELSEEECEKIGVRSEALAMMRSEFLYWYPLDLRVSGKDLVPNHLIFFLYVHVAIFPKEMWPKAIRANGHILVNAEKMSKSTGNFISVR